MPPSSLAVLVPALNRPENVKPLRASLRASTIPERAAGWEIHLVYICSLGDLAQIQAVLAEGLDPIIDDHDTAAKHQYPRKINLAARLCTDEWMLLAADDLNFHPGWLTAALETHEQTGALVIGTQDKGNQKVLRGEHATHSLVHRSYLAQGTIDEPGKLLHEGFDHNGVDLEFCETAMARGAWAFSDASVIEHMHPLWHRRVRRDATYAKGFRGAAADRRLYLARRRLWTNLKMSA